MKDRIKLWFATCWLASVFSLLLWALLHQFFTNETFRAVTYIVVAGFIFVLITGWSVGYFMDEFFNKLDDERTPYT